MLLGRYSFIIWLLLTILVLVGCDESSKANSHWKNAANRGLAVDTSSAIDYGYMLLGRRRISKYDHIVKKYARRYGFDWRLISAQIFAESSFRNEATSHVGAMGLMQIMPNTAKHLGVNPKTLLSPEQNIRLGCYYDHWLYCLWKEKKGYDRLRFTFASYNAGRGRVLKTQRKANEEKWNAVKPHLPKETQGYVSKIFRKFRHYKKMFL